MDEENFDDEMISEKIAVVAIPQLQTARERDGCNSHRSSQMFTQRDTALTATDLQKLLYGDNNRRPHPSKDRLGQLERQQKEREFKLRQKQTEEEQRQLKDCTFRPRINRSQNGQKRTLKQFLDSQEQFTKKVTEKKQQLRNTLTENKKQEQPRKKKQQMDEVERQQLFDRLYKHRLNKQNELADMTRSGDFTPQITARGKNIVRDMPIAEHLYYDAMRRMELKQKCMLSSKIIKESEDRQPNLINQKYAAQKFIKEYYGVLEDLELTEGLQPLAIEPFLLILERTGFLTYTSVETKNHQYNLALEAYDFLRQSSPNIRNICVFLMAMVGIYHVNPVNFDTAGVDINIVELNLDMTEGRKLQKHYGLLYRNRLYAESLKKTDIVENYSFKPEINPQSEQLAETFRSKMLEQTTIMLENNEINAQLPKDGVITHAELLQLTKLGREVELKKKRQQNQLENLKECTFKPDIGDNRKSLNMSTDSFNITNKFEQLYNLSKNMRRLEKTKAQLDFQRSEKECTFVPKINKKALGPVKAEIYAKDIDKTIVRMMQGRKEREAKNKILGLPNGQEQKPKRSKGHNKTQDCSPIRTDTPFQPNNTSSSFNRTGPLSHYTQSNVQETRNDEQIPFLVIDVNLGDQIQQIIVFKDQADKPEVLAEGFARKHSLDAVSKAKLVDLLRIQINSILQKIDEEEEEQDSEA